MMTKMRSLGGARGGRVLRFVLCVLCASVVIPSVSAQEEPKVAGTDVPAPKRKRTVMPAYPAAAQAAGVRGIVILEIVVGPDGRVADAKVVRSIPGLDEAALEAARQWEYEPTRMDGKPVSVRLTVPITFAMKLPAMARQDGIPELRQGVAPAFPDGTRQGAKVKAELTLEADGRVSDATILSGERPWSDALLAAIRTWRFAPDSEGALVAFRVEAAFVPALKDAPPRVDLSLTGPRRSEPLASAAAAPAPPAAAPSPSPVASPEAPAAPATPEPTPVPAATEVITAPPPSPPRPAQPTEPGASAVRDVTLGIGVPDLVSGRRPVVPPLARMARETSGSVRVKFAVSATGATSLLSSDGPELFKPAADQAVASWGFRRTTAERLHLLAVFAYAGDKAEASVALDEAPAR